MSRTISCGFGHPNRTRDMFIKGLEHAVEVFFLFCFDLWAWEILRMLFELLRHVLTWLPGLQREWSENDVSRAEDSISDKASSINQPSSHKSDSLLWLFIRQSARALSSLVDRDSWSCLFSWLVNGIPSKCRAPSAACPTQIIVSFVPLSASTVLMYNNERLKTSLLLLTREDASRLMKLPTNKHKRN